MNQIPNSVTVDEMTTERLRSRQAGLLGAMKDGYISQFITGDGLIVRKSGNSVEVADTFERPLGGHMHLESATVNDLLEWIEAKAELYGDN
jgi:hypothetical protein